MKIYYLYHHIRPDTNKIFYVGIGTIYDKAEDTFRSRYRRAMVQHKRNEYWKNIVNKCGTYNINIILETLDRKEICEREIEHIALYKDSVCNLTVGGIGIESYKHTEESKAKIGLAQRLLPRTKEWNYNVNKAKEKKVVQLDLDYNYIQTFNSGTEAGIFLGDIDIKKNISACCLYNRESTHNYRWMFEKDYYETEID